VKKHLLKLTQPCSSSTAEEFIISAPLGVETTLISEVVRIDAGGENADSLNKLSTMGPRGEY